MISPNNKILAIVNHDPQDGGRRVAPHLASKSLLIRGHNRVRMVAS